ncbi:MAG: Asp-tRNA(Asn)/Glu-tRNA(Gln) amidotransferase subunit GatC, partial [Rhodospirillaceae bacterium]|nr:Asp-tRNA(Asn)/Glu-tRNA(Gln) amidotransferase subunit GatC [Rhodospirillaceae bacterium]
MSIDKDTVARIANLARINVPASDLAALAGELDQIIGWVERLEEVDTQGVEPLASVVEVDLPRRADAVTDGNCRDKILANAT